jgi:PDZ domain-containing protein
MPLNYGLKAPGIATAVEPMVQVPSQYRHSADGSLLLTSVIPQAPILVAQWVYAHIDRSVQLVPEEEIIPTNQTIQSQAEQGHRMLLSSQTIAIIEGLRLAGYRITENSDGVTILSILKDSPAATVLKTGDIITHIDSQPIGSLSDLQDIMSVQTQGGVLHLEIRRGERSLEVSVPTLPPVESGGPVRIGIGAETHVTGYSLPFQVEIIPERIVGGPSAGLMFTLAVYNMVTPNDLTQGWRIAGTGTIDLGGVVGPIGSVQQKVVAAERAGAEFFLSPVENYQDAVSAARNIKVVQVTSAQEAIQFLQTLPSAN